MDKFKYILAVIVAAILIGTVNYSIVEQGGREWNLALHIITPFVAAVVVWFINYWKVGLNWFSLWFMIPAGFLYWIIYDWTLGLYLTGNIFHIGTTGIDQHMLRIFNDGVQYSIFKAIWAVLSWSIVDRLYYYRKK